MSTRQEQEEQRHFEDEVRRVAEAVFNMAPGECRPAHYGDAGPLHELDGLARLRDVTHVIMATVSRKLEKATDDIKKLNVAERLEEKRNVPVSKWLITKYQLDARHLEMAQKHRVQALTLESFQERFFNGRAYLSKRRDAAFGSARNLADATISVPLDEYVPLPLYVLEDLRDPTSRSGGILNVQEVARRVVEGQIIVLAGPFGAGKSLTTREVFLHLQRLYLKGEIQCVPIAVNLREHWGAEWPEEILERHARSMGFSPKEDLVTAWRAGIGRLLLDGFDEMSAQVVAGADKRHFMRYARETALKPVRELIRGAPGGAGILICGREHYFDDERELVHALGLAGRSVTYLAIGEFTEEQATEFLRRHHAPDTLPDWLPRKPLLLGWLAHRGLLSDVLEIDSSKGFGHTWDYFMRLICEREAAIGGTVMDPETLRRVLERLAADVRASSSGTGPITARDLADAYQNETGQVPGEGVLAQLQRLPGLTPRAQDPTERSFIDVDLLSALQGSAVARYILEATGHENARPLLGPLNRNAVAMASHLLAISGGNLKTALAAASRAVIASGKGRNVDVQLIADCVAVALESGADGGAIDCGGLLLSGVILDRVNLEETAILGLEIEDSVILDFTIGPSATDSSLRCRRCDVRRIHGVASAQGVPRTIFDADCQFGNFDVFDTNAAVVDSDLPAPVKALVTILRKLYLQSGGGRKDSALKRGLPAGPVLDAVPVVLGILESEGCIAVSPGGIVHPIRRQATRVRQLMDALAVSDDPVLMRVRAV